MRIRKRKGRGNGEEKREKERVSIRTGKVEGTLWALYRTSSREGLVQKVGFKLRQYFIW
jgi:hypothetical protein